MSDLIVPDGMPNPFLVPFPDVGINFVEVNFVNPIENAYYGERIAYLVNDPQQLFTPINYQGKPTVLFVDLSSDPGNSPLYVAGTPPFAVVNASPVPITIGDASTTYQDIISGTGGLTLDLAAPTGQLALGGGNNAVYEQTAPTNFGPVQPEAWYYYLAGGNNFIGAYMGNDTVNSVGGNNIIALGSGNDLVYSDGTDTVWAGTGNDTVYVGNSVLIAGSTGALNFVGGSGVATIFAGSGNSSINGGNASVTVFGGASSGDIVGGSLGNNLLVGGFAAETLQGGGSGDSIFGGTASSVLLAGPGNETLAGSAAGTNTYIQGGPNGTDLLVAGGGAVTLAGGGPINTDVMFTGPGANTVIGGQSWDFIEGSSGTTFVQAGSGTEVFGFAQGFAGGQMTIQGFNLALDSIMLQLYPAGTAANVVQHEQPVSGGVMLTLPDNTHITLLGLSNLPASNVIQTA